jgi:hypothetical protein
MPARKSRLKLDHQGLAINTDIRTAKLSPEALAEQPEVIRKDQKSGSPVVCQIYDKATGEPLEDGYGWEPLEDGYGYRWIDEDGEEVPSEDLGHVP